MSDRTAPSPSRIEALRRTFDEGFAAPIKEPAREIENLLAIRVAGDPYVLRVSEIGALVADRKIVPLPSRIPELLGLAGIRGKLVPVYSLAALLGHGSHGMEETARWLLLCGKAHLIGLSFGDFDGHLQRPSSAIMPVAGGEGARRHVKDVLRHDSTNSPVLSIPSVIELIKSRAGLVAPVAKAQARAHTRET